MKRILALALLAASALFAQTSTSAISGTVSDSSGAVVPGATVTLTNQGTGIVQTQKTTQAGVYNFPALAVGTYSIKVEFTGFKTFNRTGNILEVSTPLEINIPLEIGQAGDVVTVEAKAEELQTADATVGNVVTQQEIKEMPLNGRNPLALLVLEPGVVQLSGGSDGTGVHVNGSRDMASNTTIDGIDANESSVGNASNNVYRLNPDNVQEYKVTTNNHTAEQGRSSGASVSVATPSGTNRFHGTVFEFLRNTVLNSSEFYANAMGNPKPDIKLNQYGFSIGGPIKKNKTFFAGSWQGQKINFAQPIDQTYSGMPTLYTPTALSGVYRYFKADPRNPFVLDGQTITRNTPLLVDAKTGELRPGVRVCGSNTDLNCVASYNMYSADPRRIGADPTILKLFQSLPTVNSYTAGDGLNVGGYSWNSPAKKRGPSWVARVDHNFNANNNMFFRYLRGENNTLGGDPNNSRPQVYPGFPPLGEVYRSSHNLAASYKRVISSRMINDFTVGLSRFGFLFTQGEANPDFPNAPAFSRAAGTGFNNVDAPWRNVPRTYRVVSTPQLIDNFTYLHGAHIVKAGFNFRLYRHNDQRGQPGGATVTPLLTFDRSLRSPPGFTLPSQASTTVGGINSTDFNRLQGSINDLMGIPTRMSQSFLGDLVHDTFAPFRAGDGVNLWSMGHRLKQYNWFVQDEWKVRRNLTVNVGVRWELNMAPTEAGGRVYVPDKAVDGSQGRITYVRANSWIDHNNLGTGPRLAISWKPWSRTVFRTGYTMAFDPIASFQVTNVAGTVPGLTTTCEARVGGAVTPGCYGVPDVRYSEGFPSELQVPDVKPSSFLSPAPTLQSNAAAITVFDPKIGMPMVHMWNFSIQHELPRSFIGQVAYVARRGTRLYRSYDINQINSDGILPSFLAMQRNVGKGCRADGTNCPSGAGEAVPIVAQGIVSASFVNSTTTLNDLNLNAAGSFAGRVEQNTLNAHLRPNQQFAKITYIDAGGDSYYHSMQATLRKRFSDGVLIGLAYTLSKSIDDQSADPVASSSTGGLSTTNSRTPTDIRNWRLERGVSTFDRTHVLNATWIYELPAGKRRRFNSLPKVLNYIIGDWSLNGILMVASGSPFTVRSGTRTANYSHESRADIVGDKLPESGLFNIPGVIGPVYFRNTDGFAVPAPGNPGMGRNLFRGPGYWNLDTGLTKAFQLTERVNLQFRGEVFNTLNHPNFDNPYDASNGSGSFRSTVFAQACCTLVAPPSTRAIVDTGEAGRIIQFALKLRF
jgi:hypothetical protein